ncbi:hypothetical protein EXIGLDRAFT_703146 [Exidia glandulosa HHB12029]|uniref:F-box domain-containing protein n=1 Tax=Exidia glandulosa HHB12029 TaxID=1314781 RepID=A0A165C683_EXIGL|nr:hypothetical protein EXIGLDRAFT_703146 [Exidia glandulosa HHB12029]
MLVSSVCKHWRQVALATTTLWSTIAALELAHAAIHFDVMRDMLERSKGAPLTISLTVDAVRLSEDPDVDPTDLPAEQSLRLALAAFELVVSHAWHWYDFEVEFTDEALEHLAHFLPRLYAAPPAPLLERLGIFIDDAALHEDEPENQTLVAPEIPLFGGVRPPQFKVLTLWGAPIGWGPYVQEALLSELGCLELGLLYGPCTPTLDQLFSVLRASPSLLRFELNNCELPKVASDWPLALEANIIELPKLKDLEIRGLSGTIAKKLVELVPTPNLAVLTVELDEFDFDDHAVFFEHIVSPRVLFPALERLCIEGFGPGTDVLKRVFHAQTAVEELVFELTPLNIAVLELLRYDPPPATQDGQDHDTVLSNIPLPKLQTLRLRSPEKGFEVPNLVDVLRSRQAALCPVRSLQLHQYIVPPDHEEMEKYVKDIDYFIGSDDDDDEEWEEEDEEGSLDGIEIFEDDLDDDEEDEDDGSDDELDLLSSQFQATTL